MAGAKSYVIHMGNTANPVDATVLYYSTATSLTVNDALALEPLTGKTKHFYVQAFNEVGQGSTDTEKAEYLNQNGYGSEWSVPTVVTFP